MYLVRYTLLNLEEEPEDYYHEFEDLDVAELYADLLSIEPVEVKIYKELESYE